MLQNLNFKSYVIVLLNIIIIICVTFKLNMMVLRTLYGDVRHDAVPGKRLFCHKMSLE